MAVCLVLVETSPPPPASHAHALTRTQTHVFHSWIISVILLAVKRVLPKHWARGGEGSTLDYRGAHLLQWCFPGRRDNGGRVPADTQDNRCTVKEKKPVPQSLVWFYSRWAVNAFRSIAVFFWQAMWCALTHEVRPPSWQIKPCGKRASARARPQTKRLGRRPATIVAPVYSLLGSDVVIESNWNRLLVSLNPLLKD